MFQCTSIATEKKLNIAFLKFKGILLHSQFSDQPEIQTQAFMHVFIICKLEENEIKMKRLEWLQEYSSIFQTLKGR